MGRGTGEVGKLLAILAVGLPLLFVSACSGGETSPAPASLLLAAHAVPAVPPPAELRVAPALAADQGMPMAIEAAYRGPGAPAVSIDFGDGTPPVLAMPAAGGGLQATHTFARAGEFQVRLSLPGASDGAARASASVDVAARKVLFIQGINSQSSCPSGRHFLDYAPAWLADILPGDAALGGTLALGGSDFVYFSYSGAYCDGSDGTTGAAPRYSSDDTCASIERVSAPRLRALVDALAPARVTIVAHSMGGVVAAYLAASDPVWASQHIASIATFDSPLRGVDGARDAILAGYGFFSAGCGNGSAAVGDLRSGSKAIQVAGAAARSVPLYTLDATSGESATFGLAQTVPSGSTRLPGERLHWSTGGDHSDVWSSFPEAGDLRPAFVVCALLIAPPTCGP